MSQHRDLRRYSIRRARDLAPLVHAHPPVHPGAIQLARHAAEIARPDIDGSADRPDTPAADLIDAAVEHWPTIAVAGGNNVLPSGLWERLMNEWPMNAYPIALAERLDDLTRSKSLGTGDATLEIGAGTGNLTRLVDPTSWHVTDLHENLARRTAQRYGGTPHQLDIDDLGAIRTLRGGPFWTIVGVNVMHCARSANNTLIELRRRTRHGGRILLAEGDPGRAEWPWPLTWAFDLMDGWWDRGGFKPAEAWAHLLVQVGYVNVSWHAIIEDDGTIVGGVWEGINP